MIPASAGALQVLMVLLPGFAAAYVVQLLALRYTQTDFDKLIEAGLYSFLIYFTFLLCTGGSLPFDVTPAKAPLVEPVLVWHSLRLLGLAAITLVYAMLGTAYINLDGTLIFRKVHLTERTARRSIWNDVLQSVATPNQVVQVELGDKRSILGVLEFYSDVAEDCSIYLSQASWVREDGTLEAIPGPGILIAKNANIQSISLLDPAPLTSPPTPSPAP